MILDQNNRFLYGATNTRVIEYYSLATLFFLSVFCLFELFS
jgi:hypothetical protein